MVVGDTLLGTTEAIVKEAIGHTVVGTIEVVVTEATEDIRAPLAGANETGTTAAEDTKDGFGRQTLIIRRQIEIKFSREILVR